MTVGEQLDGKTTVIYYLVSGRREIKRQFKKGKYQRVQKLQNIVVSQCCNFPQVLQASQHIKYHTYSSLG